MTVSVFYSDIDECVENSHTCAAEVQKCENTEGKFYCTCDRGFEPTADGLSCQG